MDYNENSAKKASTMGSAITLADLKDLSENDCLPQKVNDFTNANSVQVDYYDEQYKPKDFEEIHRQENELKIKKGFNTAAVLCCLGCLSALIMVVTEYNMIIAGVTLLTGIMTILKSKSVKPLISLIYLTDLGYTGYMLYKLINQGDYMNDIVLIIVYSIIAILIFIIFLNVLISANLSAYYNQKPVPKNK